MPFNVSAPIEGDLDAEIISDWQENMDKPQQTHRPHLFVLRVWLEELGDGKQEWRGDVQDTASREKRYFREWTVLLDFVLAQLRSAYADNLRLPKEKTHSLGDGEHHTPSLGPQGGQSE